MAGELWTKREKSRYLEPGLVRIDRVGEGERIVSAPNADDLCKQGDQRLAAEAWDDAEALFRQAASSIAASKCALLGLSAVARGRGDLTQAQRLLSRCLYHHPRDPDVLSAQGNLLAERGDHSKALALFDQALGQSAAHPEAVRGKARSLLALGRVAQAREFVDSIAKGISRPAWLKVEIARVYVAEGEFDAAVEAFVDAGAAQAMYNAVGGLVEKVARDTLARAIIARLGSDPQAIEAVATAYRDWDDDDDAAIAAYTQLVQLKPNDEAAHLQLIDALTRRERIPDAESACKSAMRSVGRSDSLILRQARILFEKGERELGAVALEALSDDNLLIGFVWERSEPDAIVALENLLARPHASPKLLRIAATRFAAARNSARALTLLDQALQIDPKDVDALVAKGGILLEQGWHEALDSLLKAAESTTAKSKPALVPLRVRFLIARDLYSEAVRVAAEGEREELIQKSFDGFFAAHDDAKAEKLVAAALAANPSSNSYQHAQAQLLMRQRRYGDAAAAWSTIYLKDPSSSFALGQQMYALRVTGRFDDAAEVMERAMRRASFEQRQHVYEESGLLRYDQGLYDEAVAQFDAALEIGPTSGWAHLWKIRALRVAGRNVEAEAAVTQASSAYSNQAEIKCEMGKLQEARQDWKAAIASYADVRRNFPELIEAYFLEANVMLRLKLSEDADRLVEQVLRERGSENETKESAGWFFLSKRDFVRAESQFRDVLSRAPLDPAGINGIGGIYFEQGRYDLAEQKFRQALEIEPRGAVFWNNVAWSLVRQVKPAETSTESIRAEAERYCREAVRLSPRYANPQACLGIIAFKRGRVLECEDFLKRALDLNPTGGPHADLGALYAHLGRYDEAEKILQKGRELDPYDVQTRVELGNVYLQTGKAKEAITVLKEAWVINPNAEEAVRALSIAHTQRGDLIEAVRVLRKAISTQDWSSSSSLRVALCRALTHLADKTEDPELYLSALKEVRLAITAEPRNADAYFQAGVVCYNQRDYRSAARHLKQCLVLDNSNVEAEQILNRLRTIKRQELETARGGRVLGWTVSGICLALLLGMWSLYLRQPLAHSPEAVRQITATMLLTLSPILLALVFVALLMPWLTKLKLPGGLEAELVQPKEQISSGPSGPITLSYGSTATSGGPS